MTGFDSIFTDLIERHGGADAFTPATTAIARAYASLLAAPTTDPAAARTLLELERLLPSKPPAGQTDLTRLSDTELRALHAIMLKASGASADDISAELNAIDIPPAVTVGIHHAGNPACDCAICCTDEVLALRAELNRLAERVRALEAQGTPEARPAVDPQSGPSEPDTPADAHPKAAQALPDNVVPIRPQDSPMCQPLLSPVPLREAGSDFNRFDHPGTL